MADWHAKTTAGDRMTRHELETLVVVPHTNEHLRLLCEVPEILVPTIVDRPVLLVTLDQPRLFTCDEPVVVVHADEYVHHLPQCSMTRAQITAQLRQNRKKSHRKDPFREIIHMYPTRPAGLETADEIALPLTPRSALVLGPRGDRAGDGSLRLSGNDAKAFADELNASLIENAYDWVGAHPDHPTFRDVEFPAPGPILAVCDGDSVMSKTMRQAPEPRRPQLLRKGVI